MIGNDRIAEYIDSLYPAGPEMIEQIRKEAVAAGMPVIRRDGEQLLKLFLHRLQPRKILEVGTCVGYSAIVMASCCDARITTLEIGAADHRIAMENIARTGYSDRITALCMDATDYLEDCRESFDFIFMDAAKGQYIHWLPRVTEILEPGGILLSDNVLHDGDIPESRFAVERRDRTTHARLREYLYELTHSPFYETVVLNVADGMSISVRREE